VFDYFLFKSGWCRFKNEAGRGVLEFNTYLRREGCWEITLFDTRGRGLSKNAPKFNMYYLNGP
jgi:hypothetical protein